jgi:hypothetical protein
MMLSLLPTVSFRLVGALAALLLLNTVSLRAGSEERLPIATPQVPDGAYTGAVQQRPTDYLGSLQLPKGQVRIIQAANAGPIPIFVHVSEPRQADYLPCLYWSFDRWAAATDGRIRFQMVPKASQAKMTLLIQPGDIFAYDGTLHGDTKYTVAGSSKRWYWMGVIPISPSIPGEGKMDLDITVNTGPATTTEPLLLRQRRIAAIMLHELGHALGLWGHSPDPGDIMYQTPTARDLTLRDITTIRRLYGLPSHSI